MPVEFFFCLDKFTRVKWHYKNEMKIINKKFSGDWGHGVRPNRLSQLLCKKISEADGTMGLQPLSKQRALHCTAPTHFAQRIMKFIWNFFIAFICLLHFFSLLIKRKRRTGNTTSLIRKKSIFYYYPKEEKSITNYNNEFLTMLYCSKCFRIFFKLTSNYRISLIFICRGKTCSLFWKISKFQVCARCMCNSMHTIANKRIISSLSISFIRYRRN